jgi:hypothetical protein
MFPSKPRSRHSKSISIPSPVPLPHTTIFSHTLCLPLKNGGVHTLFNARYFRGSKIHQENYSGIKMIPEQPTDKSYLENRHFGQVQM